MKCKDQADLHREYARVIDMCVGTELEKTPWLCVKLEGNRLGFLPSFDDSPASYEFALGIVEDKLVWEGDELWNGVAGCMKTMAWPITNPEDWSWNPPAPPKPKTVSISVNGGEPITLDQMVTRFLGWRLPEPFRPDAGISFTPDYNVGTPYPMKHAPVGTNLFDADQARAMILYLLEGKL